MAVAMRRAVVSPAALQRRLLLARLAHTITTAAAASPDEGDVLMAYHAGRIFAKQEELDHLLSKGKVQYHLLSKPSTDAAEEVRLAYLSGRIDAKKEELYNLISQQIQSYTLPRNVSKAHAHLLANLSAHINPRIDEPLWFKSVRARKMERFYTFVGTQTLIILAAVGSCELIALAQDPALGWWNKRKKLAIDWCKQKLN